MQTSNNIEVLNNLISENLLFDSFQDVAEVLDKTIQLLNTGTMEVTSTEELNETSWSLFRIRDAFRKLEVSEA